MKKQCPYLAAIVMAILTASCVWAGGGTLRLGYQYLDENGNLGVNQESYNLYDGPIVSLENFYYRQNNGLTVGADLRNITLNSRIMTASLSKPGLFGITAFNRQYRRIYSFEGDKFTRRNTFGGQAHVFIHKYAKLFGGVTRVDKHGDHEYTLQPYNSIIPVATDYGQTTFNIGGQLTYKQRNLYLEYRRYDLTDNTARANDRKANTFVVSAYTPIPTLENVVLAGGFQYRKDLQYHQVDGIDEEYELESNQGWGAIKMYLPRHFTLEGRLLAARFDKYDPDEEYKTFVYTFTGGWTKPHYGGVRVAYEGRNKEDTDNLRGIDKNKTSSAGFIFSGWLTYVDNLILRGRVTVRQSEVDAGYVLVGDEDYNRYLLSAQYMLPEWGDIGLRYQGNVKKNDDIDARVDYNAYSVDVNFTRGDYGRVGVSYSYYLGKYEHSKLQQPDRYEFSDHIITGGAYPKEYRDITVYGELTYYRCCRDLDTEKIGGRVGVAYRLPRDYAVEAVYQVLNFDDFLTIDRYYTGNIVTLSVKKRFTI